MSVMKEKWSDSNIDSSVDLKYLSLFLKIKEIHDAAIEAAKKPEATLAQILEILEKK